MNMNKRITVILAVSFLLVVMLFIQLQSKDSIPQMESYPEDTFETLNESEEKAAFELEDQSDKSQGVLDQNLEEIHQCAERMSVPSFQLIKPGDSIQEIYRVAKNLHPLDSHVDLENLHFIDHRGEELRFQIIDERETRFFKVDSEGLPIRIETPELFLNMNPKDQKEALIREYRTPKFSQASLKLNSKQSPLAIEALVENDQLKELQVFKKGPQGHISLACHKESGSNLSCKCL